MIRTAAILSSGDEILSGLTVDTNANHIADRLFTLGVEPIEIIAVGDRRARIHWAFEQALEHADLVVSTGGLGPTADDLTTEVVAEVVGRELVFDEAVAEHIRDLFRSIGREMPDNNLRQARFPEGAIVLENPRGTAAGFRVDVEKGGRKSTVIVLPGVPREMKPMLEEHVVPFVESRNGGAEVLVRRVFQTFGATESGLDELLAGCFDEAEGTLAFRAAFPHISVRVTVRDVPEKAGSRLEALSAKVEERIRPWIIGEGDASMEAVVEELLRGKGWTLAVAESCTGGLVASRLTDVPGASEVLLGGIVAYSIDAKCDLLGVDRATIDAHGVVSEEVAGAMAARAREKFGATLGLSTTGVAGPEGGTEETPVGTLCVGLAGPDGVTTRRLQLRPSREWVKLLGSQIALDLVRRRTLGLDVDVPAGLFRNR